MRLAVLAGVIFQLSRPSFFDACRQILAQAANIFLYIGKARLCFFLNLLFLGINSALNYLCFKQFGPYGAAIGNVIGCVLGTIVWYSILQRSIDVKYSNIATYVVETYKTVYSKLILIKNANKLKSSVNN